MSDITTPSTTTETHVSALLGSLKRYRWWDTRAGGQAALNAIRERVASHLEALAPFGLGASNAWVVQFPRDAVARTTLDPMWSRAVTAAASATASGLAGPPPAEA